MPDSVVPFSIPVHPGTPHPQVNAKLGAGRCPTRRGSGKPMARHWLIASTRQRWECGLQPEHWTRAQAQGLDGDIGIYAVRCGTQVVS